MIQSTVRVFKYASQNFFRNFWLSLATLLVMIILVFLVNLTIGIGQLKSSILSSVNQKIDLPLFFKPGISEENVLNVKSDLEKNDAVASVTLITPEQELEIFQKKWPEIGNQLMPALNVNPFTYELVVRTTDITKSTGLLNSIESNADLTPMIYQPNLVDLRTVSVQAAAIADRINFATLALTCMLGLVAVIIIFNTIRVSIYTHRDEISIMKLVGATNWFIRMPFLVEAALYSLIAVAVVAGTLYFLLAFTQPYINSFFNGLTVVDLTSYYTTNAITIYGLQILGLLALNAISTSLALRRYLKV